MIKDPLLTLTRAEGESFGVLFLYLSVKKTGGPAGELLLTLMRAEGELFIVYSFYLFVKKRESQQSDLLLT